MSAQEWAAVVSAAASGVMVVVTIVYVVITGNIARASQQAAEATGLSAKATGQSAEMTAKTAEASLFSEMASEYSSERMYEHLVILADYQEYADGAGETLAATCKKTYESRPIGTTLAFHNATFSMKDLDEARRHIDQYFGRAAALRKHDYVKDKFIEAIASYASLSLWLVAIRLGQGKAAARNKADFAYTTWHVELFKGILKNKMFDL
jgi:hypothetical protein